VDVDFRALYRHAVGQLVAAGHRRIALLLEQSSTGGDLEAEIGFNEGIRQSRHPDADGRVFRYQPSILPLARILDRLFNAARPPSALLLGNPNFYLFAHTYLQSRGLRIPRDVSLLSCNDDPFLSFVHPSPDRYVFNTHLFAKKLFNLLMRVIDGTASEQPAVRIMPDFHKGATLAPPANETQSRAKG
jgi:DNA-binding LacI/PurR family transcriptional regulator